MCVDNRGMDGMTDYTAGAASESIRPENKEINKNNRKKKKNRTRRKESTGAQRQHDGGDNETKQKQKQHKTRESVLMRHNNGR